MNLPRLAITSGEPCGIGPDLIIQLAQTSFPAELIVIADKKMMRQRSEQLGIAVSFIDYSSGKPKSANTAGEIKIIDTPCTAPVTAGVLNKDNSPYVLETLTIATKGCLSNEFDAMVTPPLHKGIINGSCSQDFHLFS